MRQKSHSCELLQLHQTLQNPLKMQFFTSVFILAFAAQALGALTQYQFFAQSDNDVVDGHGLYFYNEGGVINYYFISNDTDASSVSIVTYDNETQEFHRQVSPQAKYFVTNTNSIFQLSGQGEPLKAPISASGEVYFGSGVKLYAAKNYGDPKGYSDFNYGVLTRDVENSFAITIIARKYES